MQTLHAEPLRRFLIDNGSLELVINFHESRIFPNVNLNLIIFKYIKKKYLKNVKIVNYRHKGKITNKIIQKITKIIKMPLSDNKDLIKDGKIEIFNTSQPNKSTPWKFLPSDVKIKLKTFEDSCRIATMQLFEDKVVDYSSLFLGEDIRSLNLSEKDFQKLKIGKLNYYMKHPHLPLDSYLSTTKSKNIFPQPRYARLADIVDIGNGMVSGLDKAFRIDSKEKLSSKELKLVIPVVKARNIRRYFITKLQDYYFVKPGIIPTEKALKTDYPSLFEQLTPFKDLLKNRYQYNRLIPYWEWVFLRNFKLMRDTEIKISVPCKDRFDKRGHLRFAICGKGVFATQDVTVLVKYNWIRESIEYISAFLNSREVFNWVRNKGLIRGGVVEFSEQPLKVIPFRFINWDSSYETEIHNEISKLVQKIHESNSGDLEKITEVNDLVSHLFA
jgi:adenine-specific DNA-methyltransferase